MHSEMDIKLVENSHQLESTVHISSGEISTLTINIQKPVLGRGFQHDLPHSGVMGVGDINHGELNGVHGEKAGYKGVGSGSRAP